MNFFDRVGQAPGSSMVCANACLLYAPFAGSTPPLPWSAPASLPAGSVVQILPPPPGVTGVAGFTYINAGPYGPQWTQTSNLRPMQAAPPPPPPAPRAPVTFQPFGAARVPTAATATLLASQRTLGRGYPVRALRSTLVYAPGPAGPPIAVPAGTLAQLRVWPKNVQLGVPSVAKIMLFLAGDPRVLIGNASDWVNLQPRPIAPPPTTVNAAQTLAAARARQAASFPTALASAASSQAQLAALVRGSRQPSAVSYQQDAMGQRISRRHVRAMRSP
jgi:hypothetical protein